MPQPCRKPLSSNPFESYRDPITGQWKVKYPASALPAAVTSVSQPSEAGATENSGENTKRVPNSRRWKKSPLPDQKTRTRVA